MSVVALALSAASLMINAAAAILRGLPTHRIRQQLRRDVDGFAAPWCMCWAYWIGADRLLFRRQRGLK